MEKKSQPFCELLMRGLEWEPICSLERAPASALRAFCFVNSSWWDWQSREWVQVKIPLAAKYHCCQLEIACH